MFFRSFPGYTLILLTIDGYIQVSVAKDIWCVSQRRLVGSISRNIGSKVCRKVLFARLKMDFL